MSKEIIQDVKQSMKDLKYGMTPPLKEASGLVQVKYDGWFSHITIKDGVATAITSGGEIRKIFTVDVPDAIVLAEWMFGTNASQSHKFKDLFIIHDVLSLNGHNLRNEMYINRISRGIAITENIFEYPNFPFILINSYPIEQLDYIWRKEVLHNGNEGLVLKDGYAKFKQTPIYRMKREFTQDYVVMGFKEGTGRLTGTLGAIDGGLYIDGELKRIISVGGGFDDNQRDLIWNDQENFMGKVFEASGKALFESGALRHPAFQRFRIDKYPQECVWKK